MFHGECTVTLQDVVNLTGLPMTGDALYVWAALIKEVLGKPPSGYLKNDERVKMVWLRNSFYSCTNITYDDDT
ncbi:hypothetical protein LINGRAPRIM_LOCUS155 [Linum grandiflorum]